MKNSFLSLFLTFFTGLSAVMGQDITSTVTHESNNGAQDGSIDLTVNGGFPPYEYSWKGPGGFTATTEDIANLAPGQYCVTVTDALCGTAALCRIVRRCDPIIGAGAGVKCPYNANGFFTLWLSGSGTFKLQWSDGYTQTQQSTGGLTPVQRTGLNPGVYCVTVTNAYGCSESICRSVSSSIQPMQVTGEVQQPTCGMATGAVTLIPSGGLSPYTYLWSDGAQTKDRTNLNPGTYTVTVTDKNSCTKETSFTITPSVPNLKISIADISMVSDCISEFICDGAINIEISGGTAPYTYVWSKDGAIFSTQQDINNLCKGNYQLTVTDASGCTTSKTIIICCCSTSEPGHGGEPCPFGTSTISINGQVTQAVGLQGGSINLSISAGSSSYSLVWKKNGQFYSYDKNITNLQPGEYCVYVNNGCFSQTKCFTIVDCGNTTISISGTTNPTCEDYEAGAVDVSVSGNGTSPYKYKWSNGSINQDLDGLTAGTYTVTVTDNNGCTGTNSFTISTTQINIVNQGCSQLTMCGSEVVEVQQFDPNWQFEPDCRYAKVVCANGYVGPLQYLGATKEYPFGPTGCVVQWKCLNGQIYTQYTGQTVVLSIGGVDACGIPSCKRVSGCYYPDLDVVDIESLVELGPGQLDIYAAPCGASYCDFASFCSNPGQSRTRVADFYCEGEYIGSGCTLECVAPPQSSPSSIDTIDLIARLKLKYPALKTLEQAMQEYETNEGQIADRYEPVNPGSKRKMLKVSPNPFYDRLTVKLFSDKEKSVNFALVDVNGKTLIQQAFLVHEGSNELVLNIETYLPAGSYFLITTDETGGTDACLVIKAN